MRSRPTRRRGVGIALGAIACALSVGAVVAPATSAAFGVSGVSAAPADTNAGANSDFAIDFGLADGQLKDLVIHLPPGLVGNPLATPTCSEAQLNADDCPAASDVGDISNDVEVTALGIPIPLTASGDVFNVAPRQGEPARFGFVLQALPPLTEPIILQSPAALRPDDFGLDTILNDVPNTASGLPIEIQGVHLDLEGQVGSPPQGFLRNPTSCGSHAVSIDATAYSGETASGEDSFDTVNCGALPFSPKFSARIEQSGPSTNPIEVSTTISQTIEEAGLKRAMVTLPSDLGPNSAAFLNTCPDASFQAGTCPESSIVGSAVAASPLQAQALTGPVVVITPSPAGSLPVLGLDLRGALALKLKGGISLDSTDPTSLRSIVTFDDLPDIPISEFTLTFGGGEGGLNLAARNPCEPPPFLFNTNFLSHSGVTVAGPTEAQATCRGSGGKKPKARVKLKQPKDGDPVLKLKLRSGAVKIRSAKVKLAQGVSFASGRRFDAGSKVRADGKKLAGKGLKASRRSLTLKGKAKGFKKIKGRFSDGAVDVTGKAKGKFKIVVRDVDGKRTKLAVRAK